MEVMDLCAGVAAICFNKVQPDPKLEPFEELGCKVKPHMVSVRDLINSFAEKLSRFILDPALASTAGLNMFVNVPAAVPGANEDRVKAFKRSAFMVMQDFKKLGFLGSDLGVPFCCMEVNKSYRGEHGEYTVDNEALLVRLIQNVQELNQRL